MAEMPKHPTAWGEKVGAYLLMQINITDLSEVSVLCERDSHELLSGIPSLVLLSTSACRHAYPPPLHDHYLPQPLTAVTAAATVAPESASLRVVSTRDR